MKTEILRLYEEETFIELRMEYFWFLNFRKRCGKMYLVIAGGIIPEETGMQVQGADEWTKVE